VNPLAGYNFVVPDFDDADQEAKDHGNLMDEGVAEVEREAAEAAGGQDHRPLGQATDSLPPTDRPSGAAAFSEAQMAEEDSERQKGRNGPSKPTEANGGSDEQAAELLAEQNAEAKDSVT
jgi:hypothetical protein